MSPLDGVDRSLGRVGSVRGGGRVRPKLTDRARLLLCLDPHRNDEVLDDWYLRGRYGALLNENTI
jgi:hypothetical protein